MKPLEEYIIPLKGLALGEHKLQFHIEKAFIDYFEDDEISDSDVKVKVLLTKTSRTIEMKITVKGEIHVPCDRCLEGMTQKIAQKFNLYLNYGQEFCELDDEVIIIPEEEGFFDLSKYIYEYIKLSIPIQKMHKKGDCDPEMLSRIEFTDEESDNKTIDPRWEALRKLTNNN